MKKKWTLLIGTTALLLIAGCKNPTGPKPLLAAAVENSDFRNASSPGDSGVLTLSESTETITMIYTQNQISISFPTGMDDSGTATLTTKFFMAETEVTNAVMAAVLQWAYDNGRFSTNVNDHNGLNTTMVKHGEQELVDLDESNCHVNYNGSGIFTVDSGYDNHPVTNLTWYGSIMFCNWLTEMRDGSADNVVYGGITNNWSDDDTTGDSLKNGYRLPSIVEREYTARYLGTYAPNTGGRLDTERKYGDDNSSWTDGYYWTPGNYASGAYTYYNDAEDTTPVNGIVDNKDTNDVIAVYKAYWDGGDWVSKGTSDDVEVKSLGSGSTNTLGLYDISGNVSEWCFSESGPSRVIHGGSWVNFSYPLQVGCLSNFPPNVGDFDIGFRLCRTAD